MSSKKKDEKNLSGMNLPKNLWCSISKIYECGQPGGILVGFWQDQNGTINRAK
jgi:hypothetical protein